mmetsp:Transcript_28513/g.49231  ORF Transcript_28513/g.49231 Transcript_28513/m.49231 type:complete len:116 (-) Transcript_28513:521-868(-)
MSLLQLQILVTVAIVQSFPISQQQIVSRPAFLANNHCNNISRQRWASSALFSSVEESTKQSTASAESEKYVIARGDGSSGGGGVPMKKSKQQQQQQQPSSSVPSRPRQKQRLAQQ